jgi:hypothetical protein
MLKFTVLGTVTVTILCAAAAPPTSAQSANPEPGYCAQFYPNSDCNSLGPETPGSKKMQDDPVENEANEAKPASPPAKPAKPRKQSHGSAAAGAKTKTDAIAR